MKTFLKFLIVAASFAFSHTSLALEVGDSAPCVDLEHVAVGGSKTTHCLTQPEKPGQNVAIVFFGTSCGPCVSELPMLNQLTTEIAGRGTLRIAMVDKDQTKVFKFMSDKKNLINMEIALDSAHKAATAFEIQFTPTMFVVGPDDKILYQHVGVLDSNEYNLVKKLLMGN